MTKSDLLYSRFIKIIEKKSIKVEHQIFYLIKYIQEMHLILECLSLSQMNRHRKEEN